MRIIIFSTYRRRLLEPWVEAIRRVPVVTDVMTIGPEEWPLLGRGSRVRVKNAGPLIARIRAWQPDCGVSIGGPQLPPLVHCIPKLGTLAVRMGSGPEHPPGFRELWLGESQATVRVQWLGIDRRGIGASGRVPIYSDDTIGLVGRRMEEMGCLLLSSALPRVAQGGAPGTSYVEPIGAVKRPSILRRLALRRRVAMRRWRQRSSLFVAVKTVAVAGWLALVRPLRDLARTMLRRHPVRIFTLHRVTWLARDGMTVSPETFRQQMEYVRRHHEVVTLDQAISLVARGERLRRPVAAVTFDDGYESVATVAEPVLSSLGIPAACFVCPDVVNTDAGYAHDVGCCAKDWMRVMNWQTLRELHERGWHIGAHTASHVRVSSIHGEPLLRELWAPRAALLDKVAPEPVAFAYPFGGKEDVTTEAVELARKCGYTAVLSDFGGENVPQRPEKFFLRRIDIGGGHDALMWRAMIDGLDFESWRARRNTAH